MNFLANSKNDSIIEVKLFTKSGLCKELSLN